MDNQLFLTVGFALVVVVAVLGFEWYRKQKRRKQLRAVASQLGYEFSEGGTGSFDSQSGFSLFTHSALHPGQASNWLRKMVDGATATVFDYIYTTGVGRRQRTHKQTVLLLASERLDLPSFALRPEGLTQKVQGALGNQDIDFAEHPGFSSGYLLEGSDEAQIRALFTAEKLAFFAERRGLSVEGKGRQLIYYRDHKLVSPKALQTFVEEGLGVLRLMAGK